MPLLNQPSDDALRQRLENRSNLEFSYPCVGVTREGSDLAAPAGYRRNHVRVRLGEGQETFEAACRALDAWRQFEVGWLRIFPDKAPIAEGQEVLVIARTLGLWWLNPVRIVYHIDQRPDGQFGFAYGTLPGHAARGEERFWVELDSQGVWFEVLAYSRPSRWHSWAGYPYLRMLQGRFGRQSSASMLRAVADTTPTIPTVLPGAPAEPGGRP